MFRCPPAMNEPKVQGQQPETESLSARHDELGLGFRGLGLTDSLSARHDYHSKKTCLHRIPEAGDVEPQRPAGWLVQDFYLEGRGT